jgi:hypothetical protein
MGYEEEIMEFLADFQACSKIAKRDQLRHVPPPARRNNSASTGRIFMKFDIEGFFGNLMRHFKFH